MTAVLEHADVRLVDRVLRDIDRELVVLRHRVEVDAAAVVGAVVPLVVEVGAVQTSRAVEVERGPVVLHPVLVEAVLVIDDREPAELVDQRELLRVRRLRIDPALAEDAGAVAVVCVVLRRVLAIGPARRSDDSGTGSAGESRSAVVPLKSRALHEQHVARPPPCSAGRRHGRRPCSSSRSLRYFVKWRPHSSCSLFEWSGRPSSASARRAVVAALRDAGAALVVALPVHCAGSSRRRSQRCLTLQCFVCTWRIARYQWFGRTSRGPRLCVT